MNQQSESLWSAAGTAPKFESLRPGVHVDVAIIGAGITGLTAALLLKHLGKRVAVLEKDRAGSGESGLTTAHITEAVDARYTSIARNFGKEAARLVASASREAIEQIESFVRRYSIDCQFRRLPGYLYTEKRSHIAEVKREAQAAAEAGLNVRFVDEAPLPFLTRGAARFDNQAQFDPRQYLNALAARIPGDGSFIFDDTQVVNVREGEPCVVDSERGTITADAVFMATHVPIAGFGSLNFKEQSYRTYVLAFASGGETPNGLFWDTADPYHYTRWQETPAGTFMIVGGEDHRVGHERDAEESFARLQEYTSSLWAPQPLRYRWSGQIVEPVDGLPYIGGAGKLYVSTGYAGQGMTLGTAGAIIVTDLILGRTNEYAELFDWKRIELSRDLVKHGLDFDRHLVARLTAADVEATRSFDVKSGQGKIVLIDGRKVALFRDDGGALHALAPVCRHMKCDVAFNDAEKTWDCPCHGSRYSIDGDVLNGPASEGLERITVPQDEMAEREGFEPSVEL